MIEAEDADDLIPKNREKMRVSRVELQNYVLNNAQQGDIQNIIDTIDQFGWNKQWLMNIGDRKGKILDQAIQTRKPKTVLELGRISLTAYNRFILVFSRYFSWI
jgi:hypothetical protein